jgi:alginate O-acetyltransferase complex protein AlgJ
MRTPLAIAEERTLAPGGSDRWLCAAFLVLLAVPAVLGAGGGEARARARAGEPPVTLRGVAAAGGIGPWLQQLQPYARASFGGRHQLVEWDGRLKQTLGLGQSYGSDVTEGRDGWLFYRVHRGTQGVRPEVSFSEAEMDRWVRALEDRRRKVEDAGAAFLVVFAPDKQAIYPDLLPAEMPGPLAVSRLDALQARLREEGLTVVDLRPALRAARAPGTTFSRWPLYWKTDTHWNGLGALLAARPLLAQLRARFPAVHVPGDDEIEVLESRAGAGDLVRMRGLQDRSGDLRIDGRLRTPGCAEATGYDLDGRSELTQRVSCPGAPIRRALVFHDSMMVAMLPALAPAFQHSTWSRQALVDPALLAAEAPEVVIFELVERTLWEGLPEW